MRSLNNYVTKEVGPHGLERSAVVLSQEAESQNPPKGARKASMAVGSVTAALFTLLIGILLLLPGSAFAQEFRGTISGSVLDPSGAVVPGASVEIVETATGTTNKTTSDKAGLYVVPFLAPGDYSITVTKNGFETLNRGGITLQAQEHPIINLTLTVGSESQSVTVTAEEPLVDQANASIGVTTQPS